MQSNHRRCGRSRPADCARGEVLQFQQNFTVGWHTLQVTEPAQSTLRQGDCDRVLFSLLILVSFCESVLSR